MTATNVFKFRRFEVDCSLLTDKDIIVCFKLFLFVCFYSPPPPSYPISPPPSYPIPLSVE